VSEYGRSASQFAQATESARRSRRVAALVLFGLLLLALNVFASILLPFLAAAGIAYFLDPVANWLRRLGVPRPLSAFVLVLGLFALVVLFLLLLYPLILAQLNLLIFRIPAYASLLSSLVRDLLVAAEDRLGPEFVDARLRELALGQVSGILSFIGAAIGQVIGGGVALFNVLTLTVVTPVVAFYLLRDWPAILLKMDAWAPRRSLTTVRSLASEVDRILSAWLRGQALVCLSLGLFYAVGLTLAGLDLGLIVGLTAGLVSFIPYVGTLFGLVTSIGLALAQFGNWNEVLVVAFVFVLGQAIEAYILYPRLLGDRVELHAVWVIFALFAGGTLMGFIGILLAVPAAATIGVLARFYLRRYLTSALYLDLPPPDQHR